MAKRSRAGKSGRDAALARRLLGPLVKVHPKLLEVLDKHGVSFCAGCYLTFFSPLDRVAAYHAVPDVKKFLRDVARACAARKGSARR